MAENIPYEEHVQVICYFERSKTLVIDILTGTRSWSYGSRIYDYMCNQCLSPLKLWVRILLMARCTGYNIMW